MKMKMKINIWNFNIIMPNSSTSYLGCVVSENVRKELSSEAKVFIPQSVLAYFDSEVRLYEHNLLYEQKDWLNDWLSHRLARWLTDTLTY